MRRKEEMADHVEELAISNDVLVASGDHPLPNLQPTAHNLPTLQSAQWRCCPKICSSYISKAASV